MDGNGARVLAGDIGGTKTNLALYERDDAAPSGLRLLREDSFKSRSYAGLEEIVSAFSQHDRDSIGAAAFGIAGPVLDGRVQVTNLPWKVEATALQRAVGSKHVRLLNDLETTAYGALHLGEDEVRVLSEGVERRTHRVVIAAGTGLGQAILFWDGERYQPSATEGGHALFAPRDEREMGLLRFLQARFGRVSYERVLSGPGLESIFDYLDSVLGRSVDPAVREALREGDRAAVIGANGVEGRCPACREAVDLFVEIYGAQAGNLVLSVMALGGVYVGGGIVTKLLPRVEAGGFLSAFRAGGRFEPLLRETPVRVILNPKASMLGAAAVAAEALS